MKQKLLYITIFSAILGVSISQIMFIPSWLSGQEFFIIFMFIVAVIGGIIYLFVIWRHNYQNKSKLKIIEWMKSIAVTLIMVGGIPLMFLLSVLTTGQGIFGPNFESQQKLEDKIIYLYHNSCFPPDGGCECDYYGSLIYIKNKFLPIMHLVKETDFYVGEIKLINSILIAYSLDACSNDFGKSIEINLK